MASDLTAAQLDEIGAAFNERQTWDEYDNDWPDEIPALITLARLGIRWREAKLTPVINGNHTDYIWILKATDEEVEGVFEKMNDDTAQSGGERGDD